VSAGTEDDVVVEVEYERKVFGKITGRAGGKPAAVSGPSTGPRAGA
jgi:hypothetical protein